MPAEEDGATETPCPPTPMLFYTFFKTQLGKEVKIRLKNDVLFTGVLESVDMFLNLKIRGVSGTQEQHRMETCIIRGSSVKTISMSNRGVNYKQLHDATRFRFV